MHIYQGLKTYFGFTQFRPLQEEIVTAILAGQDCLAILPTGGGKSLCFQLPGLLMNGNVIVVSPLISLMTDQVEHLLAKGIAAIAVHSSLSATERQKVREGILQDKYKFIYVSPETLASQWFVDHAEELKVQLLVVDEAHCISEWGHYFRPEYREISTWLKRLSQRPVVAAFTASATPATAKDISEQLELRDPKYTRQSILRPNLSLQVIPCPTRTMQYLVLLRVLARYAGESMILYGATRSQTESTAELLCSLGYHAKAYHGGLDKVVRQDIQRAFLANELNIICATTAFGMGVDKPNIRCVTHLTHPASLEHYYQEVGRAGRDGEPSDCYLLSLPGDVQLQFQILASSYPSFPETEEVLLRCLQANEQHQLTFERLYAQLQENLSLFEFKQVLEKGESLGWWSADSGKKKITYIMSLREICRALQLLAKQYNHQLQKLLTIVDYAQNTTCRMRQLLLYFEPKLQKQTFLQFQCGKCDICQPSTIHLPSLAEKRNYHKVFQGFRIQQKRLAGKELDWSLAELTLEVIATAKSHVKASWDMYAGVGRGWRVAMNERAESHQTLREQTEFATPRSTFSTTVRRLTLDQMAGHRSGRPPRHLDKPLSLNTQSDSKHFRQPSYMVADLSKSDQLERRPQMAG